ncbi:MAG: RecQ family ATP-dependent DNA helicase [Paludibacteraceae bacterium]|nr:RecQ family ATP-dependent DNA helicase [Paludibacteraceae bacterium]
MIKYTANYTYTNPNFVIQNLEYKRNESPIDPLLYVLKNILQRGFPTTMSKYLQDKVGKIHEAPNFHDRLLLVPSEPNKWHGTIKGGDSYNPAKDFYERVLTQELGEYSFVQSMIVPEISINEIVGRQNPSFVGQQVDFYLPQSLLVIEIDGGQHSRDRALDAQRDHYLQENGIETVRISTLELKRHDYQDKINRIIGRIEYFSKKGAFDFYKQAFEKAKSNDYTEEEIHDKMLPTAVIRFQLLLLDLLCSETLRFGEHWKFNIRCDEPIKEFAKLAIEDTYTWLNQLVLLRDKHELTKFDYEVLVYSNKSFKFDQEAVNIDFSLLKRYTDEDTFNREIIFVRSDYFDFSSKRKLLGLDKNYFKVSTAQSINYDITDTDKPVLRFFLQNLFNKTDFRDGQFAIIANALNLRDTVGLLPTGGGKSLCFQMPCLLQPSINFVVCPIKSLMYDQIDNLKKGDVAITNVNLICGDQTADERSQIMTDYAHGKYLFVWISPERFQIKDFRASLSTIINYYNVSYAVIDEVHCMSEWGHDFRTSYLNLAKTIDTLSQKDEIGEGVIKYIGLTATASLQVLQDIKVEFSRRKQQLEDDNIITLRKYTRPELDFIVIDDKRNKESKLLDLFQKNEIPQDPHKATLVFTPYVNGKNGCFELAYTLSKHFPNQVAWYSGSCPNTPGQKNSPIMQQEEFDKFKAQIQEQFKNNRYQVLCATKAFGMGIDKQNVYYTFHYGLPSSIEALYQEAGRAGRWDKTLPENRRKKGLCYILHSHETEEMKPLADEIFTPNLGIARMKEIVEEVKWRGEDIFRQLYLYLGKMHDIEVEFRHIIKIIDKFYQADTTRDITYDEFQNYAEDKITPDNFEKYIYRLCLLGIAEDWTRDFKSKFIVKFNSTNIEHVVASLTAYIQKYEPDEMVEEKIYAISKDFCDTPIKKAVWYLLDWIFRHITETRKQSLKNLSELCLSYQDSASFKGRLESYFTITESTYILQHIAANPYDCKLWFDAFYSKKKFITKPEIKKLRDRLSRFLESYHSNPGLNFVSGMVRALLDDFEDADGRTRFERAIQMLAEANKDTIANNDFVSDIIPFLKNAHLSSGILTELCTIIIRYFPNITEEMADILDMPWLYNDIIKKNITLLRKLNLSLYEQIGRI